MSTKHVLSAVGAAQLEEKRRQAASGGDGGDPGNNRRNGMRALFSIFPLLIIPVAIYNILAFTAGAGIADPETGRVIAPLAQQLASPLLSVPMISGVQWQLTNGDMLILLALTFLFLEILKSTSTGTATIMNHAVSMLLFILCLIEFLLLHNFATSVFFILTVMTLLDVLAGVVVTIVSARRDFAVGEGFGG